MNRPNEADRNAFLAGFSEKLELEDRLQPFRREVERPERPERARPVPVLHLEDVSEIPFLDDIAGVELYQHRARVRAGDGDLFAAVTPATDGYERYCRRIGLGSPDLLPAEPQDGALAVARACTSGSTFARLVEVARRAGGMTLHPYMGIEPVWNLGRVLSDAAGVPIGVRSPPPPVTWIANDKFLFGQLVEGLLGTGYLIETEVFGNPAGLARGLYEMAGRHARVGLKRTRCASAMGNRVFESAWIRHAGPEEAARVVMTFLSDTQWKAPEEVLVVEWVQTNQSPSTQLWVPPPGPQRVSVDGIYDQILESQRKVFLGSRPSQLARPIQEELSEVSRVVAEGLRTLGYVGRCSFDFVVLEDERQPRVRFVECNGRWGGTSTPMFLVDRLKTGGRPPYRAQDVVHSGLVGARFDDVQASLQKLLFNPASQQGHFILYNVGPLEGSGKLDVIALADRPDQADELILRTLPSALGLG